MTQLNVDDLMSRLLNVGMAGGRLTSNVDEAEIHCLCFKAKKAFMSQPSLIEVQPPLVVCGDIHGQYSDMLRIFDKTGFPPDTNFLFLGNYVDIGRQSMETICLLFCYKIKYPETFFMLRGNHECSEINKVYGFYEECCRRYKSLRLWQCFQDTFDWMPLCGLIGGRILCVHGGMSPQLQQIDQLRCLPRPQEPPNPSLGNDLLWANPDQSVKGWQANKRNGSYSFGQDVVIDLCERLELDLVVKAHKIVQDGYEFFADHKMVTIFSAPHYRKRFDNSAATMKVSEEMECSFEIYRPTTKAIRMQLKSEEPRDRP